MLRKFFGLLLFCFLIACLLGIFYLLYLILKAAFAISVFLGIFVVFFVLPLAARLLFLLFFGIFSSLLTLFMFSGSPGKKRSGGSRDNEEDDEVVDVDYRIVK